MRCRGYSLPLQRVVTDFGADVPFGRIPQKLREHHGISVPVSSAQALTQTHAKQVYQSQELETQMPVDSGVKQLIAIDGRHPNSNSANFW